MGACVEVRCWLYDVSELSDDATFSRAMECLPWEDRRARVGRYLFPKDQCLCLGAGLLAAHALRVAGATDLFMSEGPHGKLRLQRHPDIHFNLSHSGAMAICAVASVPVGADVEELQKYDGNLAAMCFGEGERCWLSGQLDAGIAFTRLWVRKESYLKLLGTGLIDGLRAIDVTPGRSDPSRHFWECELPGYALSVCCHEEMRVTLERATPGFWK